MVCNRRIATLHLFAGGGGGILADRLLGRDIVGAIEVEKYPREILLSRQKDGLLPLFPIWDDVTTSLSGMMSRLLEPITRIRENISKYSSQSGTISASQEDSLVRISASQEREPDWKDRARVYGARCGESLARFDRDTYSWKTAQCLLFEDSTECLGILPKWGMTQDGELSELMIQEHRIDGRDSGCGERERHIPTPTVMDSTDGFRGGRKITTDDNFRGVSLKWLVEERPDKMWPTPLAHDSKGSNSPDGLIRKDGKSRMDSLANLVVYFPTPGTTGLSNGSGNCEKANQLYEEGIITEEERKSFRAGNGGQLNPDWVEAYLMGWPFGWSRLRPMNPHDFEEWMSKAISGRLWEYDPAELSGSENIPRLTEEKEHRKERLIALGNGQVPSCACLGEEILSGVRSK